MVLQYVAASFHVSSVNTANIKTVQYPKPYHQHEIPTMPAVVISKVLLPQSNIMAAFVHSHSNIMAAFVHSSQQFFSDVSPDLPTYKHHVTQFQYMQYCPLLLTQSEILPKMSNCQHKTVHTNQRMSYCKVVIR
jgi:hypothetical protein